MPQSLSSYLGIHEPSLHAQARRAQVLASNLANAETPGYKARDIDFKQTLQRFSTDLQDAAALRITHAEHVQPGFMRGEYELQYRIPQQPSLDGNTVEQDAEMAAFTENSVRYLMSLRILNGKINTLRTAIRGQ